MIKVLIADDHPVVRLGLKHILTTGIEGALCGEARNAEEVLDELERRDWDLVILDISMAGRSGLDALKELRHKWPKLPVLVLSVHSEAQYGTLALTAGASGYMTKESAPDDLVLAVRRVLAGRLYLSPAMAESLVARLGPGSGRPLHERLSDREFEIMALLASGKTTKAIAEELHLSMPTVSTYRARVLEKMNMKTTAEVMHYALSNRLVE